MSNQIDKYIAISIRILTNQLTLPELIALYNAANAGFDPCNIPGYEKVKGLFTEANGTRCTQTTLALLSNIVDERLQVEQKKEDS